DVDRTRARVGTPAAAGANPRGPWPAVAVRERQACGIAGGRAEQCGRGAAPTAFDRIMSAPFILRPIATTLLFIAIIVLGLIGYSALPVAPLPSVDFPTIQVTTSFPGASPDVVETSITAPLEHHFGQISGLTSMNSSSSAGTSQITLQFALSRG